MFNAEKPSLAELPSSAQLLRSTVLAAAGAGVILVAVVLPAEYGIDPTGAGAVLGLTEMGEIKQELADEAEADELLHQSNQSSSLWNLFSTAAHAQEAWTDTVTITLAPGDSAEVKLAMTEGAKANYAWVADGGRINFDLHAHAGGQDVTYEKGSGATDGKGGFTAAFDGNHGWFWRNRDKADITVTLNLRGAYSEIVQTD